MNQSTLAKIQKVSLIVLLVITTFWFIFALLSGANKGTWNNVMNAIPWLLVYCVIFLTWKRKLIGGVVLFLLGLASIIGFDTYESALSFVLISLPFIVLGGISIAHHFLLVDLQMKRKARKQTKK